MAKRKKLPKKIELTNFWIVTYVLQDKVIKTVVKADGYDFSDNIVTLVLEDMSVAVFRNWLILEKISEEEALFLQEKQSEQETNSCPKKNLNDLLTRD